MSPWNHATVQPCNLVQAARFENTELKLENKCEFKDRVRAGEEERRETIAKSSVKSPDSFPKAPGAKHRNEPPGFLGGHV